MLGILWAGSSARGEADEHSDLDFYVLVSGHCRWGASFLVEGAAVEAFYNPAHQIRKYIAQGYSSSLHMLVEGQVLPDHPELTSLISEARLQLQAGRPATLPSSTQRHKAVDTLWEARSAIGQLIHPYIVMETIKLLLGALYQQRGWWDVKPKHWLHDLNERDPKSAALLLAILEAPQTERQSALEAFALRVLGSLEWTESSTEPEQV